MREESACQRAVKEARFELGRANRSGAKEGAACKGGRTALLRVEIDKWVCARVTKRERCGCPSMFDHNKPSRRMIYLYG